MTTAKTGAGEMIVGAQSEPGHDADGVNPDLPERDPDQPSKGQGQYRKYEVIPLPPGTTITTRNGAGISASLQAGAVAVQRVDRRPMAWCFILEDGDPLAVPALIAYEHMARQVGYGPLADDLFDRVETMALAFGGWDALGDMYEAYKDAHEASREYRYPPPPASDQPAGLPDLSAPPHG